MPAPDDPEAGSTKGAAGKQKGAAPPSALEEAAALLAAQKVKLGPPRTRPLATPEVSQVLAPPREALWARQCGSVFNGLGSDCLSPLSRDTWNKPCWDREGLGGGPAQGLYSSARG